MLNLNDRICLNINNPDLVKAIALARDFRCCTRTIKIGPALFTECGSMVVHSFRELNICDIILDTRYYLNLHEIWPCIESALRLNLSAVTVNPFTDIKIIKELIKASNTLLPRTGRVKPLNIIINANVINLNKTERIQFLRKLIQIADNLNISLIVDYYDLPIIFKYNKNLTLLVGSKRPISSNPLYDVNSEDKILPNIHDVITSGASYVILDELLLSGNNEIMSDAVTREIQLFSLGRKK